MSLLSPAADFLTADSLNLLHQIDIEEFPVDHLTLSVAQRYSVLVTARNDTSENFYMHANFDSMMFDTVPEDLQLSKSSCKTRTTTGI